MVRNAEEKLHSSGFEFFYTFISNFKENPFLIPRNQTIFSALSIVNAEGSFGTYRKRCQVVNGSQWRLCWYHFEIVA